MKSLVINLDRNPQRLEHIEKLFGELGLDFERISAVDGKQISQDNIDKFYKKCFYHPYALTPGMAGCYLSHRKCWEKVVESNENFVAIFEDDIYLSSSAKTFLKSCQWIPSDTDIIKLETFNDVTKIEKKGILVTADVSIHKLIGTHLGTGGYIISQDCAKYLLKNTETIHTEIDSMMFNSRFKVRRGLTIYQAVPAVCIQYCYTIGGIKNNEHLTKNNPLLASDIYYERKKMRKKGKFLYRLKPRKLFKEITRPLVQLYCFIRKVIVNNFTDYKYLKISFDK